MKTSILWNRTTAPVRFSFCMRVSLLLKSMARPREQFCQEKVSENWRCFIQLQDQLPSRPWNIHTCGTLTEQLSEMLFQPSLKRNSPRTENSSIRTAFSPTWPIFKRTSWPQSPSVKNLKRAAKSAKRANWLQAFTSWNQENWERPVKV